MALLKALNFIDVDLTERDATLTFSWSRMLYIDEAAPRGLEPTPQAISCAMQTTLVNTVWGSMRLGRRTALDARLSDPCQDNPKSRTKWTHLSFEDFLEAICRLSQLKGLPTDAEIHAAGCSDAPTCASPWPLDALPCG